MLPLGEAGGTFDVGVDELGDDPERVRAIVGHLARAGVLRPAPAPVDRVRGRLEAPFDGRARAACRSSAGEVLERVDALLAAGRLRSTGGAYPKLRVTEARAA